MHISSNIVLIGIWVNVCVQNPSHHFLQTFRPLRMFKIVFCDSSLYPKQLSLFFLLWLISASADRIGYVTNLCSMVELLHEFKKTVFNSGVFRHLIMSQQEKTKLRICWTSIHNKNRKFTWVLYAHSQFLCSLAKFDLANRGVRETAQPLTFCAPLLVFDKTSVQPDFAVVNCSDAVMSAFYYLVLTRSLRFLQLWTALSWRWVYFPPIS